MAIWTEAGADQALYALQNAGQTSWDEGATAWDVNDGNVGYMAWDIVPQTWAASEPTAAEWAAA